MATRPSRATAGPDSPADLVEDGATCRLAHAVRKGLSLSPEDVATAISYMRTSGARANTHIGAPRP